MTQPTAGLGGDESVPDWANWSVVFKMNPLSIDDVITIGAESKRNDFAAYLMQITDHR